MKINQKFESFNLNSSDSDVEAASILATCETLADFLTEKTKNGDSITPEVMVYSNGQEETFSVSPGRKNILKTQVDCIKACLGEHEIVSVAFIASGNVAGYAFKDDEENKRFLKVTKNINQRTEEGISLISQILKSDFDESRKFNSKTISIVGITKNTYHLMFLVERPNSQWRAMEQYPINEMAVVEELKNLFPQQNQKQIDREPLIQRLADKYGIDIPEDVTTH